MVKLLSLAALAMLAAPMVMGQAAPSLSPEDIAEISSYLANGGASSFEAIVSSAIAALPSDAQESIRNSIPSGSVISGPSSEATSTVDQEGAAAKTVVGVALGSLFAVGATAMAMYI